jgi:hypothetical protein
MEKGSSGIPFLLVSLKSGRGEKPLMQPATKRPADCFAAPAAKLQQTANSALGLRSALAYHRTPDFGCWHGHLRTILCPFNMLIRAYPDNSDKAYVATHS